ncbi:17371_t:CDS:1, partial [Gigaspora rosea]
DLIQGIIEVKEIFIYFKIKYKKESNYTSLIKFTKMSLQNFLDKNVYLDELYLQPDKETDLISDNELPLYSNEQTLNVNLYLSLDDELSINNEVSLENSLNSILSLNKELSNAFTQNTK